MRYGNIAARIRATAPTRLGRAVCWLGALAGLVQLLPYLPLLIDGGAHLIDDSLRLGFRADNAWLATLTSNSLPAAFYAGDAIGSFNWWLRLLTGLLAGFAFVRQVYPHLDRGMAVLAWDERAGQGALVQ